MSVKLDIYAGSVLVQQVDPATTPVFRLLAQGGTNPYANMLVGFDGAGSANPVDPAEILGVSGYRLSLMGTATLSGGTAEVLTAVIAANSLVFLSAQGASANAGFLAPVDIDPGVSFDIQSSNASDDRVVAYQVWSAV